MNCLRGSRGALLLWLAALLIAAPAYCQPAAPAHPAPPAPRIAPTAPRSISEVEEFVKGMADHLISEAEAIEKIKQRGINFFATPANLERLRLGGATPAILELVRKLAPEPPKPTATLAVTCAPAECDIKLNGRLLGTTKGEQFQKNDLDSGDFTLLFEKEGYLSEERPVHLSADAAASISIELEPDSRTRQADGKILFAMTRRRLGLEADLKAVKVVTGSGAMTSFSGGKQTGWNFDFSMATPNLIEMKAESTAGGVIYQCRGEKCAEKKQKGKLGFIGGGKQVKGPALQELETNLRAFAQYNIAAMLERFVSPSAQFDSYTASADGTIEQHLRVDTPEALYDVTIGRDLLPSDVAYQSSSGLGSGLKVLFGEYTKLGEAQYPKRTTIRLPDSAQHGIEVRLDRIVSGSELKETDFGK